MMTDSWFDIGITLIYCGVLNFSSIEYPTSQHLQVSQNSQSHLSSRSSSTRVHTMKIDESLKCGLYLGQPKKKCMGHSLADERGKAWSS